MTALIYAKTKQSQTQRNKFSKLKSQMSKLKSQLGEKEMLVSKQTDIYKEVKVMKLSWNQSESIRKE